MAAGGDLHALGQPLRYAAIALAPARGSDTGTVPKSRLQRWSPCVVCSALLALGLTCAVAAWHSQVGIPPLDTLQKVQDPYRELTILAEHVKAHEVEHLDNTEPQDEKNSSSRNHCPGDIFIRGYGEASLVNAEWNVPTEAAGPVFLGDNGEVVPHAGSRTYFAKRGTCNNSTYNSTEFLSLKLLGKRLRYTVDLSGAGCGCNVALALVPMSRNANTSSCNDYYCDAMQTCDVPCAEIDLQEANKFAWLSSMHVRDDGNGAAVGFGGDFGKPDYRQWTKAQYGPNASCVDTSKPIIVSVSFPVGNAGRLAGMEVKLSQKGSSCKLMSTNDKYMPYSGRDALAEITEELAAGMTPVISYWGSKWMAWLDGPGKDGNGPCPKDADDPSKCSQSVKFYDFEVEGEALNLRLN